MNTLKGLNRFVAGCALACCALVAGPAMANSPAEFVEKAAVTGVAEIETSRMAIGKTSSTDIESYAVEIIKDQTDANRDLKKIAAEQDLPVPTNDQILGEAKHMMLEVQEGDSFDAAYAASQVKAREEAIELLKQQVDAPASPALKAFAEKYLPKFEMHLVMAKKLVDAHQKT